MKTTIFQRLTVMASLLFMVNCGLQVRSNPSTGLPNPNTGLPEVRYKISGTATGIKYEPLDIPTGYAANMPTGIVLKINGEEFTLTENGVFSVPGTFKSGESYLVEIADNGLEIQNEDGITPSIYLNCDLTDVSGEIVDADVTNVRVDCFLSDSPYKDPEEA